MQSMRPEAQQMYTIGAMAQRSSLSHREKAILKGLVLDGHDGVREAICGSGAGDFPRVLGTLRSIAMKEAQRKYDATFADITTNMAKAESHLDRDARGLLASESYTYGEIDFVSFVSVMRSIRPRPGWTMADLGSGSGRALVSAALLFDFSKVVGYEALGRLHALSQQAIAAYNHEQTSSHALATDNTVMEVHNTSFLDADWSDHDIVFANSTCFDDSLMRKLATHAESLKGGAYFVTFTRPLESDCFRVLSQRRYAMAWGPATVFIHRRLRTGDGPSMPVTDDSLMDMLVDVNTDESSGDESSEGEEHTPPRRREAAPPGVQVDMARMPSFRSAQRPLGSPSSPQGNSLLRAKAARAAQGRQRSALSRPMAPPVHVDAADLAAVGTDSDGEEGLITVETPTTEVATAAAAASAQAALQATRPTLKPVAPLSASVAFEMQGVVGQSSPQGDALLAAKARRASRGHK